MSEIHLLATVYMAGIINVIHWVHYPSFSQISRTRLRMFAVQHSRRMRWIVFPVMLIELLSSPADGFVITTLTACNFLGTFVLFMPIHRQFEKRGFDPKVYEKMMRWNVSRVLFWNAKAFFLLWCLIEVHSPIKLSF